MPRIISIIDSVLWLSIGRKPYASTQWRTTPGADGGTKTAQTSTSCASDQIAFHSICKSGGSTWNVKNFLNPCALRIRVHHSNNSTRHPTKCLVLQQGRQRFWWHVWSYLALIGLGDRASANAFSEKKGLSATKKKWMRRHVVSSW